MSGAQISARPKARESPSNPGPAVWRPAVLIALFQPPVGDLNALGEPDFGMPLRVLDEFFDDFGSIGNSGNKRMEVESKEFWIPLFSLPIEIVKMVFHDL